MAQDAATAAQKPAYTDPLKARKIEPPFVTTLADDIKAARQLNTAVLGSDVGGQKATQQGVQCQQKLVGSLRRIQTAARQEYKDSDPLKPELRSRNR